LTGFSHPTTALKFHSQFVSHFQFLECPDDATTAVMTNDIYEYWLSIRIHTKLPLLRRFWPAISGTDTNPHSVFRARDKEKYKLRRSRKNDIDAYRKVRGARTSVAS